MRNDLDISIVRQALIAVNRETNQTESTKEQPALLVHLPRSPLPIKYISKLFMDGINGEETTKMYNSQIEQFGTHIETTLIQKHSENMSFIWNQYLNSDGYMASCRRAVTQLENEMAVRRSIMNVTSSTSSLSSTSSTNHTTPSPTVYKKVLLLLRNLDQNNAWPKTSTNRSKVIESNELVENGGNGGSFSMGYQCINQNIQTCSSNSIFPELWHEIKLLEKYLFPKKKSSSTVAINKHATFLPHTDSGAGAGQGISLIVGLGDYVGGQTVVEGTVHDIRYTPLGKVKLVLEIIYRITFFAFFFY